MPKHDCDLESEGMVWRTCSLGHLNNNQCKNFHSHVKFLLNINLDKTILNEKEKDFIRGLQK